LAEEEKRIAATAAIRLMIFIPRPNNWDVVIVISRIRDSSQSKIRLFFNSSLKIYS